MNVFVVTLADFWLSFSTASRSPKRLYTSIAAECGLPITMCCFSSTPYLGWSPRIAHSCESEKAKVRRRSSELPDARCRTKIPNTDGVQHVIKPRS